MVHTTKLQVIKMPITVEMPTIMEMPTTMKMTTIVGMAIVGMAIVGMAVRGMAVRGMAIMGMTIMDMTIMYMTIVGMTIMEMTIAMGDTHCQMPPTKGRHPPKAEERTSKPPSGSSTHRHTTPHVTSREREQTRRR